MSIKTITTDDLRRMNGKEGLVLQGCGGDPQEWLDGINGLLTDEGILKNGSLTNILFPFEDGVEIDMGKLAMWRLHSTNSSAAPVRYCWENPCRTNSRCSTITTTTSSICSAVCVTVRCSSSVNSAF